MSDYTHFYGMDVGKFNVVGSLFGSKTPQEYENSPQGFSRFAQDYGLLDQKALCVLENTGGYEKDILHYFSNTCVVCHRADGRQAKNFMRSLGNKAKTDALDAQALARYAFERKDFLTPF